MKNKLITALVAITLTVPTAANAALRSSTTPTPTLAILDTAIDATVPEFAGKIVHEVCILEWDSCPNGKSFMEGPGSGLTYPAKFVSSKTFNHGTQMVSAALRTNPNMNIVFVRIAGNTPTGVRQIAYEKTVYQALHWVLANASKYNIKAVSMSQGHHNLLNYGADYCPNTPTTKTAITNLKNLGIPTFFAVGNGRDYKRIDWPSCITESIAIGAVDQYNEIAIYSNADAARTDFYALGNMRLSLPGGTETNAAGTSVSTQVAAARWIQALSAKPTLTYDQLIALFDKTAIASKNAYVSYGKVINVTGAING
jgi:hypothetical protein